MGQVYQHLYGGKAGSPYLFCWVREEDTGPGGWLSLEDPVPGGRGQRAGILNRGAGVQCRLWLRGPKAQGNLYSAPVGWFPACRHVVLPGSKGGLLH